MCVCIYRLIRVHIQYRVKITQHTHTETHKHRDIHRYLYDYTILLLRVERARVYKSIYELCSSSPHSNGHIYIHIQFLNLVIYCCIYINEYLHLYIVVCVNINSNI